MLDIEICKDCPHLTDSGVPWGSSAAEDNNQLLRFILVCNVSEDKILELHSPPAGCPKILQHAIADGLENN
jgi:hypothetical protein